ncbi:peptidase M23 [Microbacterium sp. CH12i]|uniref:M15 family metallopeptidase n=1 Tax=Microbacterium sp. CH12i TaxID=1479651 RepID=UPI00046185B3|nr:M15 family metallopeptidase [Microbacterium sp. CH12i]KDA04572.1 peptidase M23 [Microbacterium sp. CH12i]
MKKAGGILIALAAIGAVPIAGFVFLLLMMSAIAGGGSGANCFPGGEPPKTVDVKNVPEGPIAGWEHEQLVNAAHIVIAAKAMNLDGRAQVIGVMTAMGESSLISIDYGDWETGGVRNPDGTPTSSIGLFQQQTWWGSVEDRMSPQKSANLFFQALVKVDGWATLQPTIAAHRVQGNTNPYHYQQFFDDATEIVSTLTGLPLTTEPGAETCQVGTGGDYPTPNGDPPGPWGGFDNGRIPTNLLGNVPWDGRHTLRADALEALVEMDRQFVTDFGYHLPINDGYRDYDQQVQAKEEYGNEAATPGTSNHGWALAIDIGDQQHWRISYSHPIYDWLKRNAPSYGWVHPQWAEPGDPGGPDEAWHWEFWGKAN